MSAQNAVIHTEIRGTTGARINDLDVEARRDQLVRCSGENVQGRLGAGPFHRERWSGSPSAGLYDGPGLANGSAVGGRQHPCEGRAAS